MAHYVGLGRCCDGPCYSRSSEMEDNDRYIQLLQKDAVENIKIMCSNPLNRRMFSVKVTDFSLLLRFVFFPFWPLS